MKQFAEEICHESAAPQRPVTCQRAHESSVPGLLSETKGCSGSRAGGGLPKPMCAMESWEGFEDPWGRDSAFGVSSPGVTGSCLHFGCTETVFFDV